MAKLFSAMKFHVAPMGPNPSKPSEYRFVSESFDAVRSMELLRYVTVCRLGHFVVASLRSDGKSWLVSRDSYQTEFEAEAGLGDFLAWRSAAMRNEPWSWALPSGIKPPCSAAASSSRARH